MYIHAVHIALLTICIAFFIFLFLNKNVLSYLLTAEILWISLYICCALAGVHIDNPILLSFTLTGLVLAGVELGIGILFFYFF